MTRILREPLVHFLILGALLFAAYAALNDDAELPREEIVVTEGQIEHLATTFSRVWLRPPTPNELKGLIDEYVKEEILSREAIKLGLDRNDTVIRRRLQQKMEFIAEDFTASVDPTEEQLAEYLAAHPGDFQLEQRFTLRQTFLDPSKRGENLDADIATLLAGLNDSEADTDIAELGDSLMLPVELEDQPRFAVAAQFGEEFAAALSGLPLGTWTGPVPSGYGVHLVLVTDRTEGRLPELSEVREIVQREWMNARREEANQKFMEALLTNYTVTIEQPASDSESAVRTP